MWVSSRTKPWSEHWFTLSFKLKGIQITSMMTFMLQRFLVIIQHLSVLIWSNSVQTFLIIFIGSYCSVVCNVFECSVHHFFGCQKGHEIFNTTIRPAWNIKSVEPKVVISLFIVFLVLKSFLFGLNGSFDFSFFARVPSPCTKSADEDEDCRSSYLIYHSITGPSLLTAFARCSKRNPGCFAFIMPFSSALNLRLQRLR